MTGLVLTLGLILCGLNAFMVYRAMHEWRIESTCQSSWVAESQILNPKEPSRKNSIVLVHGFSGSPYDYKELAIHLNSRGFRVVIPRMPGQGRDEFAYGRGRIKPQDYLSWLEEILDRETREQGVKPYLAGFSMGGAMSVMMAARGKVDRLVLIAPFYRLPQSHSGFWISIMGWFMPVVPKHGKGKINDPEGYARYTPGSMLISIPAFRHLMVLADMAVSLSAKINVPTLALFSRKDAVASCVVTRHVLGRMGNVTIKEYTHSNHILFFDYEKDALIRDVSEFLEK